MNNPLGDTKFCLLKYAYQRYLIVGEGSQRNDGLCKKNYEKLWDEKALNAIAGLKSGKNNRCRNSNMNLEGALAQIEEMEIILETKGVEGKKAKLCRIQSEEESRNILSSLIHDEVSNALKINLQEFMNLLHGSEKINNDQGKPVREKEYKIPEKNKSPSCMKSKQFIERNIQLARCGKGVFTLTDKEKLRIQNLLVENEEDDWLMNDSRGSLKHEFNKNCKYFYGFDDDSKLLLMHIDKQLEVFPRQMHSVGEETEPRIDKKNGKDNRARIDSNESKRRNQNEKQNLEKIKKLLSDLNTVTNEEINPLPKEKIELLIRQATQNLQDTVKKGLEERYKDYNVKEQELHKKFKLICPKYLTTNLVLNAKSLLPKFKFRYDNE